MKWSISKFGPTLHRAGVAALLAAGVVMAASQALGDPGGIGDELREGDKIGAISPSTGAFTQVTAAGMAVTPAAKTDTVFQTKSLQSSRGTGDNLVLNDEFATDLSSWTATGWTWDTGAAKHTTGNTNALSQTVTVTDSDNKYQLSFGVTGRTAGSIEVTLAGASVYLSGTPPTEVLTAGGYFYIFPDSGSGSKTLAVTPTSDFDGSITYVRLKLYEDQVQPHMVFLNSSGTDVLQLRYANYGLYLGDDVGQWVSGSDNTVIGYDAGKALGDGGSNSLFGKKAGYEIQTGSYNCAFGKEAGRDIEHSYYNSYFGAYAGQCTDLGYQNCAFGKDAGKSNATGYNNVFIGWEAGEGVTGSNNTVIGADAAANTVSLFGGSDNVIVGAEAYTDGNSDDNSIIIGKGAIGKGSNTAVIGNASTVTTYVKGNLVAGAKSYVKSSASTLSVVECRGGLIYLTTGDTQTLPAVADGLNVCFQVIGAVTSSIDANASDKIWLDGAALDDGDKITADGTTGNRVCLVYYSADGWATWGQTGFSDGGP